MKKRLRKNKPKGAKKRAARPAPIPLLELTKVYQEAAVQITNARRRGKVIHTAGNIKASGEEVEKPFRDLLRRKLPAKYYVGQGHIVDKNLNVSPQIDVIVADNSATPILFSTEDGTEYFPYESVYLFGSVKSSYMKKSKPIAEFATTASALKTKLERKKTPPNYIGNGVFLGKGLSADRGEDYLNPMFGFLVFADSGDVGVDSLLEPYVTIPDDLLPNIVCFLDGKLIIKGELLKTDAGSALGHIGAQTHDILRQDDSYWMLLEYNSEEYKSGHALAVLIVVILQHLSKCLLLGPRMEDYLQNILKSASYEGPLVVDAKWVLELSNQSGAPPLPPGFKELPKVKQYLERKGKARGVERSVADEGVKDGG